MSTAYGNADVQQINAHYFRRWTSKWLTGANEENTLFIEGKKQIKQATAFIFNLSFASSKCDWIRFLSRADCSLT